MNHKTHNKTVLEDKKEIYHRSDVTANEMTNSSVQVDDRPKDLSDLPKKLMALVINLA